MKLRGYLTVGVIGTGLVIGDLFQRVVVAGLARALPGRRIAILTWWERLLAHFVMSSARIVGGAHIPPPPAITGGEGVLVLMNHQSLMDIPLVVAAVRPTYPRIVTRARYTQGKALISHMVRLYQYPLVDPRSKIRGQLEGIAEAARTSAVPLMIFPEGTRTPDGKIGQWREGGLRAILGARQWIVYLMVTDGYWKSARLTDFMSNVATIDGRAVAVGRFQGPEPGSDPEPFIYEMRERMVTALAALRTGVLAS